MHYALLIYERPANYEGLSDDERRAMTADGHVLGRHRPPLVIAEPLVVGVPFVDQECVVHDL